MDDNAAISIPLLSPTAKKTTVGIAATVLLLLVGGMFVFYSVSSLRKGTDSLRWNRVQGQVLSLGWHSPSDGPDYPSVRYSYSIDARQYEGNNLCFGASSETSCKLPGLAANSV